MAVRINSDASAIKRTANLPPSASFTLAGWFKFVTVPARFWSPITIADAVGGTALRSVTSTTSGSAQLSLTTTNTVGAEITDPLLTITAGGWYFIALTGSGNAIGNVAAYIRAQGDKTFTKITNSQACNALTPGALEFGRDGFVGEFMDGDAFGLIGFDSVLTDRELLLLSYDLLAEKPFARAQPNFYWRLRGNNDLWDRSGNARHPTVTAGVDRPGPKTWPSRRRVLKAAAAAGAMSGTAAWTWGQSATLAGAGAMSGTSAWAWSQSGTLRGSGALSGSSAWQWGQSATLAGAGALSGTSAWQWSQSATLAGTGAMSASATWQWSQSATLGGLGSIAGSIPWTWSQSGDLTNATPSSGAMSGTAAWSWGQSGALTGSGALAGSIAWSWSQSATITGFAGISGSASWTWNQSATLRGVGALAGTAAWQWNQSGDLTPAASGAIAGTAAWSWNATGDLTSLTPADQVALGGLRPAGLFYYFEKHREQRRRELEEIEERERETQEIADELDRAIAEQFRVDELKAAKKAETARLQRLADEFAGRVDVELPPHVLKAIKAAAERRTFDILQRMQREILLMHAEEEAVALAVLMLDED